MNTKLWAESLNNFTAFDFGINLPINSNNYIQRILDFDRCFFLMGRKYGIYNFPYSKEIEKDRFIELLDLYIEDRGRDFFQEEDGYIKLLSLKQWSFFKENFSEKDISILVPFFKNYQLLHIDYFEKRYMYKKRIVKLEYFNIPHIGDYSNDEEWNTYTSVNIISNSNIWFPRITKILLDEKPLDISPPLDNSLIAYNITPRFNSFLRDIKAKVLELNGKILLEVHDKNYVTEDGILLDGKIIYQEDIDSGKVKIPSLSS